MRRCARKRPREVPPPDIQCSRKAPPTVFLFYAPALLLCLAFSGRGLFDVAFHDHDKNNQERNAAIEAATSLLTSNIVSNGTLEPLPLSRAKVKPSSLLFLNSSTARPQQALQPLESYLVNNTIVGNVSSLLHFAIIGFAKCSTTSLASWLSQHPELELVPEAGAMHESFALLYGQPHRLTYWLWQALERHHHHGGKNRSSYSSSSWNWNSPPSSATASVPPKFGYKQPKDIYTPQVLGYFQAHWSQTRLILTIRHPIHWFQSYWNFRYPGGNAIPTKALGRKKPMGQMRYHSIYTGLGEYHVFLAALGKTPLTDEAELSLLRPFWRPGDEATSHRYKLSNPIFLLESSQLHDTNATRTDALQRDMTNFLGLSTPLTQVPHIQPESLFLTDEERAKRVKVDLCDAQYDHVRAKLLEIGTAASQWLRNYFLTSEVGGGVTVSSPEYVNQLLMQWTIDPCTA